jgi:hypothetical protein
MTFDEFKITMQRIVTAFDPHKWDGDRESEYYALVKFWTANRWESVAMEILRTCKRFPVPAEILERANALDDRGQKIERRSGSVMGREEDACDKCHRGMVYFEVEKDGMRYDKYAACDCVAGDQVARHMVMMGALSGRPISMTQARYSSFMPI